MKIKTKLTYGIGILFILILILGVVARKKKIPIEREDLENTYLWISEFKLEKEDRLICFSDGVSQSGMGSSNMPFGWDEGVGIYIAETLSQHPGISAKELARKIVLRAERNDNYRLLDDTSCCVIYRRTPRNLLICTGPPYDEKKDRGWDADYRILP